MKKYQVVYADPPWSYKSSGAPAASRPCLDRGDRPHSVSHYYKTMTPGDIRDLPVASMCDRDSVLFLWATTPLLPEGLSVMRDWGFKYKTCITWHKERCKGMGYWFRGHTEHLLFGVRGKVPAFRSLEHNIIKAPVLEHSRKPSAFREMIERSCAGLGAKIEMFAREACLGWDVFGDECSNSIDISLYK